MTSISVQNDNHKTVMPMLIATSSVTQHFNTSSMYRHNHRLYSWTTSYTWANTRWSAHCRGNRWTRI